MKRHVRYFLSSKAEQHEQILDKHFNEIKKTYTPKGDNGKVFHNYTVYENTSNFAIIQKGVSAGAVSSVFWMGMSFVTYLYIHPWATIIPAAFSIGSAASMIQGRKFSRQLVKQIKLLEDQTKVEIELGTGIKFETEIESNELMNITDILSKKDNDEKTVFDCFLTIFDSLKNIDLKTIYKGLRIIVTPDVAVIENTDLLQEVIEGEDIREWKYEPKDNENNNDENKQENDEELEYRLEEEIKQRMK